MIDLGSVVACLVSRDLLVEGRGKKKKFAIVRRHQINISQLFR